MLNIAAARTAFFSFSERLSAALIMGLSGAILLYFVGFAHSDILHNAAHDTRHAIVTPCH